MSCYNGVTNTSSGNCGFTVTRPLGDVGVYRIDYGFTILGRFFPLLLIIPDQISIPLEIMVQTSDALTAHLWKFLPSLRITQLIQLLSHLRLSRIDALFEGPARIIARRFKRNGKALLEKHPEDRPPNIRRGIARRHCAADLGERSQRIDGVLD